MKQSPLDAALDYATRGWPVFPCAADKRPLTAHGLHDASTDPAVIHDWWNRWRIALIGIPTGRPIGAVVLDIDVKRSNANGFDTLAGCRELPAGRVLDYGILPGTPMVHTASGGLHLYFLVPTDGLRNTQGARGRGIGPGLDWRGDGGYVIVPAPGSGYECDPYWNFDNVPLAEVPAALLPREQERIALGKPVRPTTGLSPYATKALDSACRNIIAAPAGEQEATLHGEAFSIGTLAGAGGIPADFARRSLLWAARQIPSHDDRRPWRPEQIEVKVARAFERGMHNPRGACHA